MSRQRLSWKLHVWSGGVQTRSATPVGTSVNVLRIVREHVLLVVVAPWPGPCRPALLDFPALLLHFALKTNDPTCLARPAVSSTHGSVLAVYGVRLMRVVGNVPEADMN